MPITTVKTTRKPDYRDLDLDFTANPGNADISRKTGEDAVKRSIRNLILTNFYDRPFRPFIGSNVQKQLFENASGLTTINIQNAIHEVIKNFEPRVDVLSVKVQSTADDHYVVAAIKFLIKGRIEPVIFSVVLERIR